MADTRSSEPFAPDSLASANPEEKAADILNRDDETPRRSRAREWTPEQRAAQRERMRGNKLRSKDGAKRPVVNVAEITPAENEMVGNLAGTVWKLLGPFVGLEELNAKERLELGTALAPVIRKYAPMAEAWAIELNALMVIATLVQAKRKKREVKTWEASENSGGSSETSSGEDTHSRSVTTAS